MADILYTGKGLATKLPEDDGRSMSRLSDFITKAEEVKYNAFKENEREFLKNSNIDPAFFIATANQNAQTQLLDTFNKKWANISQQKNNNLSTQDKQQMQTEKNLVIAQQNDMKAKQDMWLQHRELVQKNPLRYDTKKWVEIDKNYRNTGEYNVVEPPLKSKDFAMFLQSQSNKYNKEKLPYGEPVKDKFGRIVNEFTNIPDEDIPAFIESNLFADDQALQGLTEEFLADKSPEKMALLTDTNKDGKIDNTDADENVIIKWAKNNPKYINAVRKLTTSTPRNQPSTGSSKSKTISPGIKKTTPVSLSKATYNTPYEFNGTYKIDYIPTVNAKELSGLFQMDLIDETNVKGYLKLYDEEKDAFVFVTAGKVGGVASGTLIEVPAEDLRAEDIKNIPVTVDGNSTTIEQVRANRSAQAPTQTTKDWSKYKVNNGRN